MQLSFNFSWGGGRLQSLSEYLLSRPRAGGQENCEIVEQWGPYRDFLDARQGRLEQLT